MRFKSESYSLHHFEITSPYTMERGSEKQCSDESSSFEAAQVFPINWAAFDETLSRCLCDVFSSFY